MPPPSEQYKDVGPWLKARGWQALEVLGPLSGPYLPPPHITGKAVYATPDAVEAQTEWEKSNDKAD